MDTQVAKPKIIGTVNAMPWGDERAPSGEFKDWIVCVESEDNGELKATALIEAQGRLSKAAAHLLANMLNEWAGKEED